MIGCRQQGRFDDLIVPEHPGIFASVRGEHESGAAGASRGQHTGQSARHEPVPAVAVGDCKRSQQDRSGLQAVWTVDRRVGERDDFLGDEICRLSGEPGGQVFQLVRGQRAPKNRVGAARIESRLDDEIL